MKKILITLSLFCSILYLQSQNVQLHYDFGRHLYNDLKQDATTGGGRQTLTSTLEVFKIDTLGSFFCFADFDYSFQKVYGAYWEISHEFCFWKKSKVNWLSIHAEYDGGLNREVGGYNDAWLLGLTYSGHSKDYSKTWSLSATYKLIPRTIGMDGRKDVHQFQITGVWGIEFAKGWCTFSGYVDFWREPRPWQGTQYMIMGEPQFWVNLDCIKGWNKINLSVGTEVEISNNFINKGIYCIPTLALKWDFARNR